jgi:hypothetical protein
MALVQYLVYQLALRVDPKAKNGDKFVQSGAGTGQANIGSTDGDRFPAAQLLKIYNQSRIALFQALEVAYPDKSELTKRIGGTVQHIENFSFTLTGSISRATKPTGYIRFISAAKEDKTPIILLGADEISLVQQSTNPYRIQSSTGPIFIFEVGNELVHYGTFLPTLSTYILNYIGITDWAISDVTNGTSVETVNEIYHPLLLDLAVMIANGAGNADVVAMAKAIVESKKS